MASELEPGTVLQVRVGQGQRGAQVTEILAVEEGAAAAAHAPARATRPAVAQTSPGRSSRMTGTVKWYSPERGFGFVAVDGGEKEVFVHATTLQRSRLASLTEGQRVTMEVGEGRKGSEAITVSIAG